jgi:hypothetical protein
MKSENLVKLLRHVFPSQEEKIVELIPTLPEEVEDAHVILNQFRKRDPSRRFSSWTYNNVVFK